MTGAGIHQRLSVFVGTDAVGTVDFLADGQWIVRDGEGRFVGIFRSRRIAALAMVRLRRPPRGRRPS